MRTLSHTGPTLAGPALAAHRSGSASTRRCELAHVPNPALSNGLFSHDYGKAERKCADMAERIAEARNIPYPISPKERVSERYPCISQRRRGERRRVRAARPWSERSDIAMRVDLRASGSLLPVYWRSSATVSITYGYTAAIGPGGVKANGRSHTA